MSEKTSYAKYAGFASILFLLLAAIILSLTPVNASAEGEFIAIVGETECDSVADVLDAIGQNDGYAEVVIRGEISETIEISEGWEVSFIGEGTPLTWGGPAGKPMFHLKSTTGFFGIETENDFLFAEATGESNPYFVDSHIGAEIRLDGVSMITNDGSTLDKVHPVSTHAEETMIDNAENVTFVTDDYCLVVPDGEGGAKLAKYSVTAEQVGLSQMRLNFTLPAGVSVTANGEAVEGGTVLLPLTGAELTVTVAANDLSENVTKISYPTVYYNAQTGELFAPAGTTVETESGFVSIDDGMPENILVEGNKAVFMVGGTKDTTLTLTEKEAKILLLLGSIKYLGGSIRVCRDADEYEKADLRFGFSIQMEEGVELVSTSFACGLSEDRLTETPKTTQIVNIGDPVSGNTILSKGNGEYISNLVITGIDSSHYGTQLYALIRVTVSIDGETFTLSSALNGSSLRHVAEQILLHGNESQKICELAEAIVLTGGN